ncbi:M42 family metallopeptidase [bacterium]|nr:M42 family metallopeptidase [bacterium]
MDLLKDYCLAHGAPSHENEVRNIFIKTLKGKGKISQDKMGGVLCTKESKTKDAPRVLITGHMDEVGFAVQNITQEGFLQITNLGGWWTHNLLAQRLTLQAHGGKKYRGVVASTPPHFLSPAQRDQVLSIENLFVDIGADSKEHVEKLGIRLGDTLVPESSFETLANPNLLLCKAFDNRVGIAVSTQAFLNLSKKSTPCHLLAAGTVQEEVGLRGAKVMAHHARPDVVLVLEGPPADDAPSMDRNSAQGALGKGPQIRLMDPSAIMNRGLVEFVVSTAKKSKIPHQLTVRRSGGTDAGSFHQALEGIPCIVIGVPARYIHTHNSIIDKRDYLNTIKLVEKVTLGLTSKVVTSF